MAAFPALEVLTRGANGLDAGKRISIDRIPFVIGRLADLPLQIPSGMISRHHCQLTTENGRWLLQDLETTNGTWHKGKRIEEVELRHGDVFDVGTYVTLRFLEREPVELRDAAMEQAIREDPDDDRRWSVYADWLQERGEPLGERLANRRHEDDFNWLGSLSRVVAKGECAITWAHGVPSHAVLRHLASTQAVEPALVALLAHPLFRFLRSLELGICEVHRQRGRTTWAERVLELIGLEALPMLERITIGPGTSPPATDRVAGLLEARRKRWPRFSTTVETLHPAWKPATLTHEDRVVALPGNVTFHVGPRGSDLEISGSSSFGLLLFQGVWRLTLDSSSRSLKVNGVAVRSTFLRPGDELEPVEGVVLRFDA